jgi:hypothetical protein
MERARFPRARSLAALAFYFSFLRRGVYAHKSPAAAACLRKQKEEQTIWRKPWKNEKRRKKEKKKKGKGKTEKKEPGDRRLLARDRLQNMPVYAGGAAGNQLCRRIGLPSRGKSAPNSASIRFEVQVLQ